MSRRRDWQKAQHDAFLASGVTWSSAEEISENEAATDRDPKLRSRSRLARAMIRAMERSPAQAAKIARRFAKRRISN
jgi:hypothetical protein